MRRLEDLDQGHLSMLELQRAAYHEAGHAAVARHLGLRASAEVWPNLPHSEGERLWGGQCRMHQRPSARQAPIIALAGELAIVVRGDPGVTALQVFELLADRLILPSKADSVWAGDFRLAQVEETLSLVRELWPEIDDEARELRRNALDQLAREVTGAGEG